MQFTKVKGNTVLFLFFFSAKLQLSFYKGKKKKNPHSGDVLSCIRLLKHRPEYVYFTFFMFLKDFNVTMFIESQDRDEMIGWSKWKALEVFRGLKVFPFHQARNKRKQFSPFLKFLAFLIQNIISFISSLTLLLCYLKSGL